MVLYKFCIIIIITHANLIEVEVIPWLCQ